MKQHYWCTGSSTSTTTSYIPLLDGTRGYSTTGTFVPGSAVDKPGTVRKLYCRLASAISGGQTVTYTVQKNSSSTSLATTLTGGGGTAQENSDVSDSVTVVRGDLLRLMRATSGTPTLGDDYWQVEIECTDGTMQVYGSGTNGNISTTPLYSTLTGCFTAATASGNIQQPFAVAGTITGLTFVVPNSMAGASSRTLALVKDAVTQDGSAGTPDTRATISSGTSATADFSLSVAVGDRIGLLATQTGTPTSERLAWGWSFVPTTSGQSLVLGASPGSVSTYPSYSSLMGRAVTALPTSETFLTRIFTAEETFEAFTYGPGSSNTGTTKTGTVRKNGVNTGLTAAVVGPSSSGETTVTASVAPAAGDTFAVSLVATAGVETTSHQWSLRVVTLSAGPPGAITDLSGTAVSSTQVDLTWTAATDATSHRVERATVP